jgi:hypothetical protein
MGPTSVGEEDAVRELASSPSSTAPSGTGSTSVGEEDT